MQILWDSVHILTPYTRTQQSLPPLWWQLISERKKLSYQQTNRNHFGNTKICYICKEKFEGKYAKDKKYHKVRGYCHYTGEYRGAAHIIKYSVPKEIPIAFHNGPYYDYHFIIKVLPEESEKQFTCLGEHTEKYITFSVSIEKVVPRIDKKGKEITKTISYRLQFIDSARFMASSLSNLVNNLAEEIHKIKCKYGHNDKKCETFGIKYKDSECCFEYINFKDDLMKYKCLCSNKNYLKKVAENLKKQFFDICQFSSHDINKFILLLRKDVYPYEYMDD